ncbi:MAG: hypothetical protein M1814_003523 [Vezdaea aestivalis]|nr:MAG: hypothetical protein M1814_003523 [Vezdaea aestivalis]
MLGPDVALGIAGLAVGLPGMNFFNPSTISAPLSPPIYATSCMELFQALRNIFEELLGIFPSLVPPDNPDARPTETTQQPKKLSRADQRKAEAAVRRLDEWSDRFFKRAVAIVLFGRYNITNRSSSLPVPTDTGVNEPFEFTSALRKIERVRDATSRSSEPQNPPSKVLLEHSKWAESRVMLRNSGLWAERAGADAGSDLTALVEYRTYSDGALPHEIKRHRKVVREVTSILYEADTSIMGVLHCEGFVFDELKSRFELRFPVPKGLKAPRSLLDLLCDPVNREKGVRHALNQRISIAKRISLKRSMKKMKKKPKAELDRQRDWLQIPARKNAYPYRIGQPFLVGFDHARKADSSSLLLKIEDWRQTIYLSPERCRLQPGDEFTMQHDTYSLGVLLLEIAFWASFSDRRSPQLASRVWKESNTLKDPEELKRMYIILAKGTVPRLMGQRYADVVLLCLSGLEDEELEGKLKDMDGIVVGTVYITKIFRQLEEIVM